MWTFVRPFAVFMLLPLGALAQDLVFSPYATEICLANGGSQADCVGRSAQACIDDTDGGYSTVGMGACFDAEYQYWDKRLNIAYGAARAAAKRFDAENGGFGVSKADALRDMQRAWIPFRDARCMFEYSQWGGGTGGGPASAACLMSETARQTLYLEVAE